MHVSGLVSGPETISPTTAALLAQCIVRKIERVILGYNFEVSLSTDDEIPYPRAWKYSPKQIHEYTPHPSMCLVSAQRHGSLLCSTRQIDRLVVHHQLVLSHSVARTHAYNVYTFTCGGTRKDYLHSYSRPNSDPLNSLTHMFRFFLR